MRIHPKIISWCCYYIQIYIYIYIYIMILYPLYSYQYPLIFIQNPWTSPRCPCPACQEPTFMIPTVVANATRKQTGSTLAQDQTWLVVWNIFFFQILGIIIPTDFHIFQRARSTTNQKLWQLLGWQCYRQKWQRIGNNHLPGGFASGFFDHKRIWTSYQQPN